MSSDRDRCLTLTEDEILLLYLALARVDLVALSDEQRGQINGALGISAKAKLRAALSLKAERRNE